MKRFFKTMAFTLLGLVLSSNLWAADTWEKLTSVPKAGDVVILVNETAKREMTGISTTKTKYGLATTYSTSPAATYPLTVCAGSSDGTLAFKTSDDKYLTWTSGNSLNVNGTLDAKTSWTVSVSDGNFTITNANTLSATKQRYLKYNNGTNQERFACYESGQQAVQLYKKKAADPTFTITAQSNNTDYGTVSLSGSVITASPKEGYGYANPAYTVSPVGSATVSQSGNEFTVTPSANTTITINFAEKPYANIIWSINNGTVTPTGGSTKVYVGEKVTTLPTEPTSLDCDGEKVFVGWTNAVITNGAKPAVLFTDAASAPEITSTSAVTYYAVFANQDGEGVSKVLLNENWSSYSINENSSITLPNTSNKVAYGEATVSYSATVSNTKLYQAPSIYEGAGNELLLAKKPDGSNSTFTISGIPTAGLTTATISFWINANTNTITLASGTNNVSITNFAFGDNKNTSGSGAKRFEASATINIGSGIETFALVFTNGSSSNCRIDNIVIGYESSASYSDYVTTCSEVTKYTITATVNEAAMGSATVQGQASFDAVEDAELALVAVPNDGYKFVEWTANNEDCAFGDKTSASTTLLVGTSDVTVTANFAAKATYTITWLVNGNAAQGTPTTSVLEGEAITDLPTAPKSEDCYSLKDFVGWTAIANYSNATDAPDDLFTTADKAPAITDNTTFYAVFAAATGAPTFNLTAASDMVAGVYAIGALRSDEASNDYYFADGTATTGSNGDANVTESYVTAENGVIASLPTGAVEFTFTGDNSNGFTISFVDGNTTKYLGYTAASNRKLAYGDYSTTKWIVDAKDNPLNEGGVTLYSPYGTDQKYRISENSTATSAIRGYFGGIAYRAIYLFKKGKGSYGDYAVTCVAPSVENPVFETDATNPYVTSVKVELSCETEGATIYYNIDSEPDPTSESDAYDADNGIVLNTNGEHTIKAIAIKGEDESQVVSKTYTVLIPYTTAAALQGVATTTETTVAVTFNDWIVTGVAGKNAYIVDGNNNGVLVFTDGHGFAVNDHVSGTVITTLVKYNGSCELKGLKASDFTTVEQGAAATPVEFTDFSQLTSAYQSAVVTLKNAKFNSSKLEDANGVKITPFTTFYSGAVTDLEYNASYDYTGVVVMFNIVEVCPRNAGDIDKLAEKTSPTVAWYTDDTQTTPLTSAKVSDNETFSAFLYTNNNEGTKTYSSTNTEVATIDAEGAITIKGIGQTTIKCIVGESTLYYENEASFTLQVKAAGSDDVTWVAEEQGYSSGSAVTTALETPVTIAFAKAEGSNDPKYYENKAGNAVRLYQSNTLTITAPEGQMINSVVITYISGNKNAISANTGSITTEGLIDTWIGMTKNVVFTAASDASASWIYSLKITYMTGIEVTLSVEDINMQVTDEPKTIVYNCVGKENPTITYSDYDEDVISIAEGKVTAKKAGSTEVTAKIAQEGQYSSAEAKFTVTVTEKTPVTLSFEQESYTAKLGETFTTPTLTKSAEVAVTYSSSNKEVAEVNETTGAINHKKQGTTTITASFAGDATYEAAQTTYELKVVDPDIDILTATLIGKTSYENWSNVTDATGTEYAGNSTTGSQTPNVGSIQIRTTNSNSGIVSTHAIGYLRGVTVDFSSDPASGKSLNVYAKNTAYESAADLYDSKKQGTLIGSFTTSGDIVLAEGISFDDNYKYIGVRSSNGAMYLNSISIKWEPVEFGPDFTLEDKAAGAFATICLPRKIDHVENATLFHILDGDITKVNFESVTDFSEEQAGMPYLVQVTADGDVNFYYAEAGEAVSDPVTPEDANGFVGRLAEGEEEITSETALLVSGGKLYQAGTGCYLTQHHAYIEVSAINTVAKAPNMAARRVTLYNAEAQTPTNLNGLNGNMKAQKVMKDGQFYIIREAKMYNAQGIEVQ